MAFIGDFDIFIYQREKEEEKYKFSLPSPLYYFNPSSVFCKKKYFFCENGIQIIDQIFLKFYYDFPYYFP